MVTALSNGVYIIESDAGDNQNWLHDPENIDLDNFTEGDDYCYIPYVESTEEAPECKFNEEDFPGGIGYATPLEERHEMYKVEGFFQVDDRSQKKKVKGFWTKHTNISDNTVYLIIKHGTDDYETFWDDTRTEREYCKGVFRKVTFNWENEELTYFLKAIFRSVW